MQVGRGWEEGGHRDSLHFFFSNVEQFQLLDLAGCSHPRGPFPERSAALPAVSEVLSVNCAGISGLEDSEKDPKLCCPLYK